MNPRIYVYKITFLEVPHYYYGMHEEKKYNEYYMGSPKTHKNYWKKYTPQKEILETFENRKDAINVEIKLIEPVYKTDQYCLNECCNGVVDIEICKMGGLKAYEMGLGVHARTENQMTLDALKSVETHKKNKTGFFSNENQSKYGKICYDKKSGVHALTKEQKIENALKSVETHRENKTGFFSSEVQKQNALKCYKKGLGVHALTKEQKQELGRKTSSQRWKCTITGYISSPGGLSKYQNYRNIDTKNRVKIS